MVATNTSRLIILSSMGQPRLEPALVTGLSESELPVPSDAQRRHPTTASAHTRHPPRLRCRSCLPDTSRLRLVQPTDRPHEQENGNGNTQQPQQSCTCHFGLLCFRLNGN